MVLPKWFSSIPTMVLILGVTQKKGCVHLWSISGNLICLRHCLKFQKYRSAIFFELPSHLSTLILPAGINTWRLLLSSFLFPVQISSQLELGIDTYKELMPCVFLCQKHQFYMSFICIFKCLILYNTFIMWYMLQFFIVRFYFISPLLAYPLLNRNSIGVKYALIVSLFWIETLGICHDYGSIIQENFI